VAAGYLGRLRATPGASDGWIVKVEEPHAKNAKRAKDAKKFQLRAWSSADKTAAIPMWRALGFGLCPATTYPRAAAVEGYFVALVL